MNYKKTVYLKPLPYFTAVLLGTLPAAMMAQDTAHLEEVLVTAQKREQSLQEVPISLTAISGGELDRFAIKNFDDVIEFIPGISSNSPNISVTTRSIGIRGVQSQNGTFLSGENTVGFYINNTPIAAADPRLVDLERVEVLRGPQGTLYGASSLAGLMKLVTKKPDFEEFSGHVTGEINTIKTGTDGNDFEIGINIPITDNFAIRASGFREELPAYIDARPVDLFGTTVTGPDVKDFNEAVFKGGRVEAYWEATENFRANLSYMKNETTSTNSNTADAYAPAISDGGLVTLWRFPTEGNNDNDFTSLEIEWDIGPVQIQSTSSQFNEFRETLNLDGTNSFGLLATPQQITTGTYQLNRDEFTQEIRVVSTWDSKFNFIVGGFYSQRDQAYDTRFPQVPGTNIFGFPNPPDGFIFWSSSTREINEKALFTDLTYDITEQWSVSAGVRFFKFKTALNDHFRGNPLFVAGSDSVLSGNSAADDNVSRFNLQYRPTDDIMLYATAAEGFRSGGSNFPLPPNPECTADLLNKIGSPTAPNGYTPDGLWNYELGLKSAWMDNRVTLNAAVFLMDWSDIQVGVSPLCGLNGTTLNAGTAESKGVEVEVDAAVTENLVVSAGVSYIDAAFTEDVSFGGSFIFARKGSAIPDIPEWTGNLRASYNIPINDTFAGFVRMSYSYRGERSAFATTTSSGRTKDAYNLLALRLGVHIADAWTVTLYGENLTNEQPSFVGYPRPTPTAANVGGLGIDFTLRPRVYGLNVRYDF